VKSWRLWRSIVPDIGAFLVCGTASWMFFSGWASYRCGLRNSINAQMVYCTIGILVEVLSLSALGIRFGIHAAAGRRVQGVACVVLFLGLVAVFVTSVVGPLHLADYSFDHGFRDWARSEADISAIREWTGQVQVGVSGNVAESEWPLSVVTLRPQGVYLHEEAAGHRYVALWWGGGHIGRRELVVGSPDMEIPSRQTVLAVEAGVFVERYP